MRRFYVLIFIVFGFIVRSSGQTLTATPSTLDFGSVCVGSTPVLKFTINGTSLTNQDISIAALPGFTYSTTSTGTYSTTLTLNPSGASYAQDVYVKFSPTEVNHMMAPYP